MFYINHRSRGLKSQVETRSEREMIARNLKRAINKYLTQVRFTDERKRKHSAVIKEENEIIVKYERRLVELEDKLLLECSLRYMMNELGRVGSMKYKKKSVRAIIPTILYPCFLKKDC